MKIQIAKREDGPAQQWAEEHGVFWRWNSREWHAGYPVNLRHVHRLIEPVPPNIGKGDSSVLGWLRQTFPHHFRIKDRLYSAMPDAIVEKCGRPIRFIERDARKFRLFDVNEVRKFTQWDICCPDYGEWAYAYGFGGTHIYFKNEVDAVHARLLLS